jgi:two-component system, LytTR family, response regulator
MSDPARRLRAVVVDDEPLAREGIASLLDEHGGVDVVGSFEGGTEAIEGITRLTPDVVFLDVQMPGTSGFEVLSAIELDPMPAIIFVTAYDRFAVQAFEVRALDYLLKPVTSERLAEAMERAREHLAGTPGEHERSLRDLLGAVLPPLDAGAGRLIVREVGRVEVVPVKHIDWIEGAAYYVKLHVSGKVHMLRESLTSLEQRLDQRRFLRIHRSAIVNLTRVASIESRDHGDGVVQLVDGTRLKVNRARRGELEQRLQSLHDEG